MLRVEVGARALRNQAGGEGGGEAWFPCIFLISDFEQVKASGNPTKSPFRYGVIWGVKIKKKLIARVDSRFT